MRNILRGGMCFIALTLLTHCSPTTDQNRKSHLFPTINLPFFKVDRDLVQFVLDDGTPLADAEVLIGEGIDKPFAGNFLKTDANGQLLAPKEWTMPLTVTVSAANAIRTSYLQQVPEGQLFVARRKVAAQKVELHGVTTGFKVKNGDDLVDFALSMPTFQRRDLFNFKLDSVISPERDKISAGGQDINIPSNTSLPKQTESYFISVTLNKPNYRVLFDQPGPAKVMTLRGQFPFKKVVKQFRNKKGFVDVLNDFSFHGGSLVDVHLNGGSNQKDLPVDQFGFSKKTRARMDNYNSDEVALAVAVGEQNGVMFPTDVKTVAAGQSIDLAIMGTPHYLALLKKRDEMQGSNGEDHLSASLTPFSGNNSATFLAMIKAPKMSNWSSLTLDSVSAPNGLYPVGVYAVLSNLQQTKMGMNTTPLWEVYSTDWITNLDLPKWPGEGAPLGRNRWKASILASTSQSPVANGPQMLDSVTHATSNSIDF